MNINDLTKLMKIDQNHIINILKERYNNNVIYTNIDDILIAINPYKKLPIYGYTDFKSPHVYNIAKKAIENLKGSGKNQTILVSGESGSGKCHGFDTPILMYDGTIKMVQNIKENELLMGDDSTPRKVLSLARGQDEIYEISNIKGDVYNVNEKHILCLKSHNPWIANRTDRKSYQVRWINIQKMKMESQTFSYMNESKEIAFKKTNKLLNEKQKINKYTTISVKNYLKLSKTMQKNLQGYKNWY